MTPKFSVGRFPNSENNSGQNRLPGPGKLVNLSITQPRIVRFRLNLVCGCFMGSRRLWNCGIMGLCSQVWSTWRYQEL